MSKWFYNDKWIESIEDFPEGTYGFIYITIHEPSNKAYLGKKDNVIGNSTYSWWAAWLNKNQNKKVYSPHYKQWFGTSYSNLDTKDLIPVNWIQTEY